MPGSFDQEISPWEKNAQWGFTCCIWATAGLACEIGPTTAKRFKIPPNNLFNNTASLNATECWMSDYCDRLVLLVWHQHTCVLSLKYCSMKLKTWYMKCRCERWKGQREISSDVDGNVSKNFPMNVLTDKMQEGDIRWTPCSFISLFSSLSDFYILLWVISGTLRERERDGMSWHLRKSIKLHNFV